MEIWEIQGDGSESPFQFEMVTTTGNVITARGNGFFFMQTPASRSDNNPLTSDGILVNTSYSGQVGDLVEVTGRILEADGATIFSANDISITTIGNGQELPAPVVLGEELPSGIPAVPHSLERVESMLVQFDAIASGPTFDLEITPVTVSGQRPFREPGIRHPGLPGLPVWDSNPEVFWFDPDGLNQPNNRFINAGASIAATAIMVEADVGFWQAMPLAYEISGEPILRPARAPLAGEFTLGSANALQLLEDSPTASSRIQKFARYIVEQLHTPDILALQEVGNLSVVQRLATAVEGLAPGTGYQSYLIPGEGPIQLAFLVSSQIPEASVTQLGANEFLTQGGRLHDRPPLLLEATLPTTPPVSLRVLNLHLRSLLGIEGPDASFVRNKRHQQGISVANMVQELRTEKNLFVLGDFNAFQFSDGYVDICNQISGSPSLGAQFNPVAIVAPPLNNLILELPPEERYSFVFEGNAQILDQCLASETEGITINGLEFARGNADNALAYFSNPSLLERTSDHDGFVVYLAPENPLSTSGPSAPKGKVLLEIHPDAYSGGNITIESQGAGRLLFVECISVSGQQVWKKTLSGQKASLLLPNRVGPGFFLVRAVAERNAATLKYKLH